MAKIIGRVACPWCGFASAHVKHNDGKLPFVYCPEDGLITQARNKLQVALLTRNMRPEGGALPEPPVGNPPILAPGLAPAIAPPAAKPPVPSTPVPAPAPAKVKPVDVFSQLLEQAKGGSKR